MGLEIKKSQGTSASVLIVLSVLIVIGAIAVASLGVYGPAKDRLESTQASLSAKQQELDALREKESTYQEISSQNERVERRLQVLQEKIPSTTNELNHFLDSVNQRARSSRVGKWTLFKQEGEIAQGDVTVVPIRMEFTSTYEAALQFFWELASMGDGIKTSNREQLINIHSLTMTRENSRDNELETQVKVLCVAETYLYKGVGGSGAAKK